MAGAREVIARCEALAKFSEDTNSLRRTFLSPPMHNCHAAVYSWLKSAGVSVRIDAAGNLRGFYPGADPKSPRMLIGSHLDTVPNAGKYDGMLGVVLAIALLEELDGTRLPFGIEVVGFSEEEGVRFGVPFIGSRALVGRIDPDLLQRRDYNGISVREAIQQFGLDDKQLGAATLDGNVLGYLEFHIEQGPVLEKLERQLGIVEALVGQTRLAVQFFGKTNHAGTTPMEARHDALAGAAEWMVAIESRAKQIPGLVATVGFIEAKPGATNVIPGEVRLSLDVRHRSDEVRMSAVRELTELAEGIAKKRGLLAQWNALLEQASVLLDEFLADQIESAIRLAGCEPHRMTSGAGHDAMILAEQVPSAMVFLRSPGGISHDPAETVLLEDVEKAIDCGVHLLSRLAASQEFLGRKSRA
ncbi:MAG TPA: allantoate amidohydrolase [Candidatus Dormibacteraeota bacterium]|nr:allantoate amidohydrolase [Candidatus Dormibacteraeota bacterium]